MTGLDEADGRITAVRNKFERQLQRLRERERLVEVSRQDCQKEEEALHADRDRHREQMEQVNLSDRAAHALSSLISVFCWHGEHSAVCVQPVTKTFFWSVPSLTSAFFS